jgi:DNA-binding transcriptional regulator YiaG
MANNFEHNMIKNTLSPLAEPSARGARLKSLRKMTGLSRREFSEKHEISANTLQNWEDGKSAGLTEKGAKRIILALREEGIQAATRWLLCGEGAKPYISEQIYDKQNTKKIADNLTNEELNIITELQVFRINYKDHIDMIVSDNAMAPHFMPGDYIAGRKRYAKEIKKCEGLACIVETTVGEIYLRYLRQGSTKELYTLLSSNVHTNLINPVFCDLQLISAAPVIWHRKKDF